MSARRAHSRFRWASILAVAMILFGSMAHTALADEGTSSASCGYSQGDGSSGDLKRVDHLAWPGQKLSVNEHEDSWYLPCGPRNYINSDGSFKEPDGSTLGDLILPYVAYMPNGLAVNVYTSLYFQLNQNESVLREIITFCFKYSCANQFDLGGQEGQANASTPGWNKMLAENVGPSVAIAIAQGFADPDPAYGTLDESIYQTNDPTQRINMANKVSNKYLMAALSFTYGSASNYFCDSGTSGWADPANPGAGGNTYTCNPIRLRIDKVVVAPYDQQGVVGKAILDSQTVATAQTLYGDDAQKVLADKALIEACAQAGAYCSITIDPATSNGEAAKPDPTETPTPES